MVGLTFCCPSVIVWFLSDMRQVTWYWLSLIWWLMHGCLLSDMRQEYLLMRWLPFFIGVMTPLPPAQWLSSPSGCDDPPPLGSYWHAFVWVLRELFLQCLVWYKHCSTSSYRDGKAKSVASTWTLHVILQFHKGMYFCCTMPCIVEYEYDVPGHRTIVVDNNCVHP
jgi:hypothetical protein